MAARININADLGEGHGAYDIGDDLALLDIVKTANIACGMHGGDATVMRRVVGEAARRGVSGYSERQRGIAVERRGGVAQAACSLGCRARTPRGPSCVRPPGMAHPRAERRKSPGRRLPLTCALLDLMV